MIYLPWILFRKIIDFYFREVFTQQWLQKKGVFMQQMTR